MINLLPKGRISLVHLLLLLLPRVALLCWALFHSAAEVDNL